MANLGLFDLLSPYFLAGVDLGASVHDVLSFLHVDELHSAWDETGATTWGVAHIDGDHSPSHTAPQGAVWDWHDVQVTFRLTAARSGSTTVHDAVNALAGTLTNLATLVNAFGDPPGAGSDPSDYPGSQFKLEVLITAVSVHLPFLRGATVDANGLLKEDPAHRDVKIILPRILLAITQGASIGDSLNVALESWGAEGLDDPSDLLEADLIEMDPPYALVSSDVFGFGFRKAILDLSDDHTPPEILSNFGVGDDWHGVYLPELRIFVAPSGLQGLAVDASVKDLLIGLDNTPGVSGDFELDVINQGRPLDVQVRFYDAAGKAYNVVTTGTSSANSHHTAVVTLPTDTTAVVDVQNAQPPYTVQVQVNAIPVTVTNQRAPVHLTGAGTISVHVADSKPGTPQTFDLDITTISLASSTTGTGGSGAGTVTMTPAVASSNGHSIVIASQTTDTVTLTLAPLDPALMLTANGTSVSVNDGQAVVSVPRGSTAPVAISATWPGAAAGARMVSAYYHFDELSREHDPNGNQPTATGYVLNAANTGNSPDSWVVNFQSPDNNDLARFVHDISSAMTITINGYASYESPDPQTDYNQKLSERRAVGLQGILTSYLSTAAPGVTPSYTPVGRGNTQAINDFNSDQANYSPAKYWRAEASYNAPAGTSTTVTATLQRSATAAPPPNNGVIDPPPGRVARPDFFRRIAVIVRISQNTFIALEVKGEVDFQTAAEDRLQAGGQSTGHTDDPGFGDSSSPNSVQKLPGNTSSNPDDGVVDFDLIISHDDSTDEWREALTLGAGRGDRDGLLRWGSPPAPGSSAPSTNFWRDVMGVFAVMAPLLNHTAPSTASAGDVAELVIEVAIPFVIAGLGLAHTETITLYGGELIVREREHGGDGTLLFDYETDLWVDIQIGGVSLIKCTPDKPIKVRYRAVGFRLNFGSDTSNPVYQPMFDSSKGYSIDVTDPGTFHVPDPLGTILQVLGTRIARTNPLNLELDIGLKANLGIVNVDRVRVRVPLDPPDVPTITALGVSVNTAVLQGRGYLAINSTGFAGQLDLTLVPLKIRIAAGLGVSHVDDGAGHSATAVVATLRVEWPTPIPLYTSGLGLYGILGLFAMHYHRPENSAALVPALDWFINRAHGDPSLISAWEPLIDRWSFGIGAVLGTVEGGFVLNLKGMVILELPGPRLLIFMNANILFPKPPTAGTESGTILAVIDLDFGRSTITIGLSVEYKIERVFKIHIPADAFFDFNNPDNFYLDVGTYQVPATAIIFDEFRASGYLEIHGNGITAAPFLPPAPVGPLSGFSIAVGFQVSLIWGDEGVGLYLKVTAGFDAGLGFSPFHLGGEIRLKGELHLFIIGIEASGKLDFSAQPVSVQGQICGEVDFLFFSVGGCVGFSLGGGPAGIPDAPSLVRGMYLQSRSPALVVGTGVGRPIDGKLCDATTDGSVPVDNDSQPILVPIDSIPVLQLEAPPVLDSGFTTFGASPGQPPGGWFTRGKLSYTYTLQSVEISPSLAPGGDKPSVWRSPRAIPNGDNTAIDLALLDWVPNATPKAIQRSAFLTEQVSGRWGGLCQPVAPPASVLWSFQRSPLGPSASGWTLQGIAWPDPPGMRRSALAPLQMRVTEPWRTGQGYADALLTIGPAKVIGSIVPCTLPGSQLTQPQVTPLARLASLLPHGILTEETLAADLSYVSPGPGGPSRERPLLADLLPTIRPTGNGESAASTQPSSAEIEGVLLSSFSTVSGEASAGRCPSRVLEGPFTYGQQRPLRQSEVFNELVGLALSRAGQRSDNLGDTILIDAGPLQYIRLLVLLPATLLKLQALVLRPLDASGTSLGDVLIDQSMAVTTPGQLPPNWINPNGPWYRDVVLGWEFFALLSRTSQQFFAILINQKLPTGTVRVELGLRNLDVLSKQLSITAPSYLVAVIEALSVAEEQRVGVDEEARQADINTIDGLIGSDPANRALFAPGTTYTVTVNYTWQGRDDLSGQTTPTTPGVTQRFTLKTDNQAPTRLDPWLLCMSPTQDEGFHFYGDPINVVFSTDDVVKLFAAYGKTLNGVVRAASFRSIPQSTINSLEALPGAVLDPWEDTLGQVLDGNDCTISFQLTRHGRATLSLPLDPLTSYIFDIEQTPPPAPPPNEPILPLFRRSFTTSRYRDIAALATDVAASKIEHRRIAAGMATPLTSLAATPTDVQLEQALRDADLGALRAAVVPRVFVIWQDGSPHSQPVAVLIDTPEPLWRQRLTPTKMPNDNDPEFYWDLQLQIWLQLVEVPDAGGPIVNRFVRSPGGGRTLVILNPAALGRTLHLSLQKNLNSLLDIETSFAPVSMLTVYLPIAPWEDPL